MNSNTDKARKRKSTILIFFYLTAVVVYAYVLRQNFVPLLCFLRNYPFETSQLPITVSLVIIALVTPVSFFFNRNLQGPFAGAGIFSMFIVCLVHLFFMEGLDETQKNLLVYHKIWYPTSSTYVFLTVYVLLVDYVVIYFRKEEKRELKKLDAGNRNDLQLELEIASN